MANIIQIKRSSNTGEVPHYNELAVGELAVNLADGILFTKATTDGDADDVIRLGGDNYSLANASTGSGSSAGARITLNRATTGSGGGTQVADGTFDILGSSSISVTHSSGQVVLAVEGGAAINKLQSDDGGSDFAVPSSGIATIAGGTGITTSDSGATLTVTADLSLTNTATMTNKTLTSPKVGTALEMLEDAVIIFEGSVDNTNETTPTVTNPTADRTITLPDVTGTVVTTGDTNTVSNAMITNSTITMQGDTNSSTVDLGDTFRIISSDAALSTSVGAVGDTHSTTIAVNVDDSSIEIDSSNGLQVKSGGVTNAMLAGSIADSKLNTISTAGKVALSALEIDGESAAVTTLADDDLFIVDDANGAGTGNAKMAASVIKTYVGIGDGAFAISNLDVDGGTDKAAPVVGDEVIIADSEAAGATKKADIGSILDIISGDVAVDASGVATIQADSVALGTDTTGNFVRTINGTANEITVTPSFDSEGVGTVTLALPDDVTIGDKLTVDGDLDVDGAIVSIGASTSETTVEDNLTVVGDLTVNGTTTTVNTSTLQVSDPLIQLADGNVGGDALDIGFFGEYADSGNQRHSGFVRDASLTALNGATHKGSYVLFSNGTVAPTTTFDASGTYDYGALVLQHLAFGTNSASAVGNATTTPHVLAAGGTTLSHTDGFAAPGQIKRFTMDNCIIDGGSFDGSA